MPDAGVVRGMLSTVAGSVWAGDAVGGAVVVAAGGWLRAAFSRARTAFQRARVPMVKTVRTRRIMSWLITRPQKRP
nr:hypothetical protein [Streptomyces sp. LBUM 1486]